MPQARRRRPLNQTVRVGVVSPRQGVYREPRPPMVPKPQGAPQQSPPGQPQQASAEFTPDAEYLSGAAQRAFERQKAIEALTSQSTTDKGDTSEAIRRLLAKAPEQRQSIKQSANKAGLFYSGQLGKQLGEYEANLTQRQGDIELDAQRREQARAAARAAIEQGAPLEEAAALAEAATRRIGADTDLADAGALVPTPLAAAPPRTVAAGRHVPPARRRPRNRRRRR